MKSLMLKVGFSITYIFLYNIGNSNHSFFKRKKTGFIKIVVIKDLDVPH